MAHTVIQAEVLFSYAYLSVVPDNAGYPPAAGLREEVLSPFSALLRIHLIGTACLSAYDRHSLFHTP